MSSSKKMKQKQSGKGLLDSLKKLSVATGIKPSSVLNNLTKDKGGLVGFLGAQGSKLLKQKGFGSFKPGCRCRIPNSQRGNGFFDDVFGAIATPFKSLVKAGQSIVNPILDTAERVLPIAERGIGALGALRGGGKFGKNGPNSSYPNAGGVGSLKQSGRGSGACYPNQSSIQAVKFA